MFTDDTNLPTPLSDEHKTWVCDHITELLRRLGYTSNVSYEESLVYGLVFVLNGDRLTDLIRRNGEVLFALENIVRSMFTRDYGLNFQPFFLDIGDWRRQEIINLKNQAREVAKQVLISGQSLPLPLMSAFHRKFIHNFIATEFPQLKSDSVGEYPQRTIYLSQTK